MTADDALIEAIAQAVHRSQDGWPIAWADLHEDAQATYLDEARAAYAALVEHLGLTEETERGRCEQDIWTHEEGVECTRGPDKRRLVSTWVEVP